MQTTAGSLALVGSVVPRDAEIVRRLRNAGAVILGKTNLGEWANFRGSDIAYPLAVGWSARGGNTINAYNLSYTSWDSSLAQRDDQSAWRSRANDAGECIGAEARCADYWMKAMRGRIALQEHCVRNRVERLSYLRELWECARVLASLSSRIRITR